MICGDLKEGIKVFNRNQISIIASQVASVTGFNAFENDMTLFRGILRMDVKAKDTKAFVNGMISITDDTVSGS